ncbi:serine-rich adhesin for platelets-like [Asterias rubens]|uniref:serine-rich adhesin for platelets-like n=1 Tax=Asterias rubens TaxID=7604 RepID=UPI00145535F5|nr:serine-rich adhesin for platelets-like [Asterias rubens]
MARTVTRKHTAMYSPSSYFKQKVTRAARSAVLILRRGAISLGALIVRLVGLLTYLNVLPHLANILKPSRQFRRKTYEYSDFVTYLPGFRDRVVQFISTESANKKRVLCWVWQVCPSLQHVTDLSSQWCDGIALCVLLNAVVPGTCPRHDLLRPDHSVNNCRLAVRLVQRNLGIRQPIMPEEMGDPKKIGEKKMMQYINSIRYASYIPVEEPETPIKLPEIGKQIELNTDNECTASGSGLVVAVIDKRARFNITTQTYISKNLYVEITGPNREKVRRKILTSKIVRGALVNANASQSSKDEPAPDEDGPPEPIPLDYQVIKPGLYQVNYIPRSLGIYQVKITWGGEHIKNSPFKVRSTTAKNIEQTTVKGVVKAVSFQEEQYTEHNGAEAVAGQNDTEGVVIKCRRQSLVRQPHISTIRDSYESTSTSPFSSMCSSMVSSMDHSIDNTSDVFLPNHGQAHSAGNHPFFMSRHGSSVSTASSRSGSILSRSSSIMYSTDRPPTVKTRRKVIRRIIKGAGGTEEVTYPNVRSSSQLSSSQMSSMASSPSISTSMSIDDRSPKFSTSSSSSGASSSRAINPSAIRTVPPTDRYADHMSKIIMGKALNEIAKQVAMNLNSNRQTKDNKERVGGEVLTVKRTPNDSSCQLESLSESQLKAKTESPSSCVVGATAETGNKKYMTRNQPENKEKSADLDNYLQTRKQFLREIGSGGRPCESTQSVGGVMSTAAPGGGSSAGNTTSVSTSVKSTETTPAHSRRIHKKRKEDKATQCTAQDIKTATGWVSRRNVYRNAHVNNRQKDSNGDSALGESEGSVANSSSEKETAKTQSSKLSRVQSEVVQHTQGPTHLRGAVESSSRPVDSEPHGRFSIGSGPVQRRGRSGTHSSQGRQSTFDSGFSDENGHLTGHESRRNTDEMRSRIIAGLKSNGKKEENLSLITQSAPLMQVDRGVDITTNKSKITHEGQAKVNEITTKQQNSIEHFHGIDQTHAMECLTNIPANSNRCLPTSPQEMNDSSSPENENDDSVSRQFLTVECNGCQDSSTAPTPGGSSVGNISTPEDEDASAESKSNTSSDIPEENKSPKQFGEPSVMETPYTEDSETLDAMLRTLENDPEYSTREFLRKYRPVLGDELGILAQLQEAEQPSQQESLRGVASYHKDESSTKEGSLTTPSQPIPERCHASGVGLHNGIVGDKNNFQVRTISAGDGSLSVTIRGPRPHTVNETNVVYTGDDLYEVIYDVSLAGFYVISVKWAEKHIPDSPFIVKITF